MMAFVPLLKDVKAFSMLPAQFPLKLVLLILRQKTLLSSFFDSCENLGN